MENSPLYVYMLQLPAPPLHPMLQAYGIATPDRYVLEVITKIRSRLVTIVCIEH